MASALIAGALPLPGIETASAHGFHTTEAELHHRPEEARLLASILVAEDDLVRAAGSDPVAEAQVRSLVKARFRILGPSGPISMSWAGMERERRGLWLHFSFEGVPSLDGVVLEHELLLETEPFVVHTVRLFAPGHPPRTFGLDRGLRSVRLDAARSPDPEAQSSVSAASAVRPPSE